MTDAEIIKALELCFTEKGTTYTCAICPYHSFGELCKVERDKDALDLIKRQKAEIEKLQKENKQFADIGKMYSEIKVETVKKFKNTIRVLFRLEFLRRKRYDKIFDEAEAIMLKGIAGDT